MKTTAWRLCAILILAAFPTAHASIEEGIGAVKRKDYASAFTLFSAEAKKGNPSGLYYLGRLHEQGFGVAQSATEAAKYYRKAFEALSKAAKEGKPPAPPPAAESVPPAPTASEVPAIEPAPSAPADSPTPAVSSDPYARPPGMSDVEWRDYCRGKACAANRKVVMGAVEMYNMSHPEMLKSLTEADIEPDGTLMKAGSLKSPLTKPTPECSYSSEGDLTSVTDCRIRCAVHGSGD